MEIYFFNQTSEDTTRYQQVIEKVFETVSFEKEFSIIFVDDAQIRKINSTYRKIDRVTDVISFALCDDPDESFEEELGDIFIDIFQALRQAEEYGHSVEREIAFLAVHGYLHLCGYDHQTKPQEEEMFSLQEKILNDANLKR